MAEGLEAPCYNVKRQLPFEEPVAGKKENKKKNLPDLVGGCCGWFCGSGRSSFSLVGVEGGPPHRGARVGGVGHPSQVTPS